MSEHIDTVHPENEEDLEALETGQVRTDKSAEPSEEDLKKEEEGAEDDEEESADVAA